MFGEVGVDKVLSFLYPSPVINLGEETFLRMLHLIHTHKKQEQNKLREVQTK
jgi:hypothetical protein